MKKIFGITLLITGSVMSIFSLILKIIGQASASVIREADGPTTIFIAGKIGGSLAVKGIFAGAILVVAGAAIIIWRK